MNQIGAKSLVERTNECEGLVNTRLLFLLSFLGEISVFSRSQRANTRRNGVGRYLSHSPHRSETDRNCQHKENRNAYNCPLHNHLPENPESGNRMPS